ncbi:MAG: hypothetical protein JWR26_273 [Pedosphaera sp.]|nr:hypothetical protein [Pedosphaera sp.]
MSKQPILSGQEFTELCARLKTEGRHIRAVQCEGPSGYRVYVSDAIQPELQKQGQEGHRGNN